ncbi:hypothetical protein FRC12_010166 [Ceratobasidium sp. 428]|nr:hypothetical protein FRC12_010166 [Ceratobasidium sp. 428]
MGLARTPPQIVYPRNTLVTPTTQSSSQHGASSRPQPALPRPSASRSFADPPFTPVKNDGPSTAPRPELVISASPTPDRTPLPARLTPVAAARPILTQSENGPLNARINSLQKQLGEVDAQRKQLKSQLAETEKNFELEAARRERTIKDLAAQHELDKREWNETTHVIQVLHNLMHRQAMIDNANERIAQLDLENRMTQQDVRILVRDHSLVRFQTVEEETGKESIRLRDQLKDTQVDLEETQHLAEQYLHELEREKSERREAVANLKSQLERERKVRSSAETGKGSLESTNAQLASDLERAQKELSTAQSRIKELQTGAAESKSTYKSLEKTRAKHESEIEKLTNALSSLETEHSSTTETITELEEEIHKLEGEREKRVKAEVEYKALQKRVLELERGQEGEKEAKKAESELKKALKEMKAKVEDAQAQAREAQQSTKAAEARAMALEKKLASSKDASASVAPVPTQPKPKDKGKGKGKVCL